jgi:TRAP-type C4-dicarboxylate transport system permease large subunit
VTLGAGEVVLIAIVLAVTVFWVGVPIAGIRNALRRVRERRRSMVGVVWPIVNITLIAAGVVYQIATEGRFGFIQVALVMLNACWLYFSLAANRAARALG